MSAVSGLRALRLLRALRCASPLTLGLPLSPSCANLIPTLLLYALRAVRRRPPRVAEAAAPSTSRRIPDTRTSRRSEGRCACSRRGGPPRKRPPHRGQRSRRTHPLRGPPCETPDPLARLLAGELPYRLSDHLFEAPDPILDDVRDEGLEVVELLPGRRQFASSFLILRLGLPPVTLLRTRRLHDLFLAAEFLESGNSDVDGVPESTRLGPRLSHPDQVRSYRPVHVLRGSVTDAGELALLSPDHGLHNRDLAVLLRRNLQELRLDAPEPPAVRLLKKPRIEHEPLALALDHVLFPHHLTSSDQKPVTLSSLNLVRMWSKINIRRSARRYTGVRREQRSRCGGGSGRVSRVWSPCCCRLYG